MQRRCVDEGGAEIKVKVFNGANQLFFMKTKRMYPAIVAVLAVLSLALVVAVVDQRQAMSGYYPKGGGIVVSQLGGAESWGNIGGAFAQQQVTDKALFVSGSATASDTPDKVTITFSIETLDASAAKSQADNAQSAAAVRAALVAKGIAAADIQTTGYTLSEYREYNRITSQYDFKGFKTIHSMKIELTDINKAGEMVDAAVSGGATRITGIYFGLSDARLAALRVQALKSAAEDARLRGDSIASGLGLEISRVMSASESYSYAPSYRNYAAQDSSAGASAPAPTEITPGDVSVSASVSVVFLLA